MASLELNQMDIYVGNLPYTATEGDVTGLFAAYGPVERVKIITDRETGQSKGFAFVTLGDQTQLNAAIEALNDYDYNGRALRVNASEPKESRPSGGGGGYTSIAGCLVCGSNFEPRIGHVVFRPHTRHCGNSNNGC